jgi:hypothetical protein
MRIRLDSKKKNGNGWAIAIVILAVAIRIACVLVLRSHEVPRSTYEHGEIAANLVSGRGFSIEFLGASGPTSQQAPLYPLLVSGVYLVGGIETPRSLWLLQMGQALLGGLMVLGVQALARRVAPGRKAVALCAGFIAAIHPTLVYCVTHVQVSCLAATLLVWAFVLAYRAAASARARDVVLAACVLGLLVLTDPILGLTAPGMLWFLALERRDRGALFSRGTLLMASACLVVAPWIVRNALVHGEFVFVKSTLGYAFWQGNCRLSEGTDKVVRESVDEVLRRHQPGLEGLNRALWAARHEAGYIDDIALTPDDKRKLARLSEPERSRVLFRRALTDLRAEPGRYPRLCAKRLAAFILFDDTNPKTRNLVYRGAHLALTLAALAGLCLMPRSVRRSLRPTFLVAALIALFHSMTIVSARFHIPLEPLLALWSGCGMSPRQVLDERGVRAECVTQPRRLTVS